MLHLWALISGFLTRLNAKAVQLTTDASPPTLVGVITQTNTHIHVHSKLRTPSQPTNINV
jgi:hypothetical protein